MKYVDEVEMCKIHLASTVISTTDHADMPIGSLKRHTLGEVTMDRVTPAHFYLPPCNTQHLMPN